MKLVADIDTIMSNLNGLASSIETYDSDCSSFESSSISSSISTITSALESYKETIATSLKEISTSSNEYKNLVDECCTEYQANESNTTTIDVSTINEIITNNPAITTECTGNASKDLTGLPSTTITTTGNAQAQQIVEKYADREISSLSHEEFIEYIAAAAQLDYETSGILPSVTIAQAICESYWGDSSIGNNIFGIKCGEGWTGKSISCNTHEEYNGQSVAIVDDFRDYDSIIDGVADHSSLLNKSWYQSVREACDNNDAYEACRQLQADGYATASDYANTLISIIDDNDLTQYDNVK